MPKVFGISKSSVNNHQLSKISCWFLIEWLTAMRSDNILFLLCIFLVNLQNLLPALRIISHCALMLSLITLVRCTVYMYDIIYIFPEQGVLKGLRWRKFHLYLVSINYFITMYCMSGWTSHLSQLPLISEWLGVQHSFVGCNYARWIFLLFI